MATSNNDTLAVFHSQDHKFRKACQQIRLLNHRIEDTQARYDRAYSNNQRSYRYTLRLQLATLEGMRNMFYEYACCRADELEELQEKLIAAGYISDTSDTEEEMEYWSSNTKQPLSGLHIFQKMQTAVTIYIA